MALQACSSGWRENNDGAGVVLVKVNGCTTLRIPSRFDMNGLSFQGNMWDVPFGDS